MEKLPRSYNLCVVTYGSDRGEVFPSSSRLFLFFFFLFLRNDTNVDRKNDIPISIFFSFFASSFFFVANIFSIIVREQQRVIIKFLG